MEAAGQYIVMIIAATILCSLISSLLQDNAIGKTVKLLCRIFLLISIIQPVAGRIIPEIRAENWLDFQDASLEIQAGEEYARRTKQEYIKKEIESYIWDKASSRGDPVSAEVHLGDEDMLPTDLVIMGSFGSEQRSQLEEIIEMDLGITKEHIAWIGTD